MIFLERNVFITAVRSGCDNILVKRKWDEHDYGKKIHKCANSTQRLWSAILALVQDFDALGNWGKAHFISL